MSDSENLSDKNREIIPCDENGFFPGENENEEVFTLRISSLKNEVMRFKEEVVHKGSAELDGLAITSDSLIPEDHFAEASQYLKRYEFSISWVPGFYTMKLLPPLCGGCSIITDSGMPFFILKSSFRNKKKWLIYNRSELLAHELCHIARMPLEGKYFEELMAYRISNNPLRRFLGSCFHTGKEQLYLLIPIFILLVLQILQNLYFQNLMVFLLYPLAAIYPAFLLIRNYRIRGLFFKAIKNLKSCFPGKAINADAVLFRCTEEEIQHIASCGNDSERLLNWIAGKTKSNIRWQIISGRFLS